MNRVLDWFRAAGREPFPFQLECWEAYLIGRSGLLHAPTGTGKTLAAWLGPVMEFEREGAAAQRQPLRVLWITPMRALATDTTRALQECAAALELPWTVEKRTSDTSAAQRARQRESLPTALVTTPESLSIQLSQPGARQRFAGLRAVIVDEWHELLSTKRGVQAELCLARLRRWTPGLRIWGLSATLSNLDGAMDALLGAGPQREAACLISGDMDKAIEVETVLPARGVERFPWAGHLGLSLIDEALAAIDRAKTTLFFTNTRSQAELWYRAILRTRPEWMGQVAIHHGSLERGVRDEVENLVRDGRLRCVVCTSSLDLGVDFSPVDQVIQAGGPKGIARLIQRAGRSGHAPGRTSRVLCIPTHAMELVEFAAARDAVERRELESREPLRLALDVLAQHLITIALSEPFDEMAMLQEVRSTHAFSGLTDDGWHWCLDFVTRGGTSLSAYPRFNRLQHDESGRLAPVSPAVSRMHRLGIGTITAEVSMTIKFVGGRSLGSIEEDFIARLSPGDRFVFGGRVLELVRVHGLTAQVRASKARTGLVPHWQGTRMPLSSRLAHAIRRRLDAARAGQFDGPEMQAARPLLELQAAWSVIPAPDELLIETTRTREGFHTFLFPFAGRLVHEGLGALLGHRLARSRPLSLITTANDYGLELLSREPLALDEAGWRSMLSSHALMDDLLACVNTGQLARRQFRDIARIAGLVTPGYPGAARPARHLQASSELFFDVLSEFDPANMLIDQARREVLDEQLECSRLRAVLEALGLSRLTRIETPRLTPLAFPLWAESLRAQQISSETWESRVRAAIESLEREAAAGPSVSGRR